MRFPCNRKRSLHRTAHVLGGPVKTHIYYRPPSVNARREIRGIPWHFEPVNYALVTYEFDPRTSTRAWGFRPLWGVRA